MNTEKTVTFLLKSKEFENYEQEFKKLINIGNEFQYLERKYIEEFEKYQKIIEDLENKKLSIVKLYCKATLKNKLQKCKTLEREKIVVDGKIKNFNVRLQITKDFIKKLSLMTEQEQFLMQSRIVKENENKFHLLIIDKYLKSNQLGLNSSMMMTTKDYKFTMNSNSKKIIDGDSYKLWIQEIIQFCKKNQDKLKNQNLVLLSDVIKSSWTDMIRKSLILEDKKYEIWESINLTEDSDEGIGESINSTDLQNQPSTSGYQQKSPQM
ncbi:hypothetical protein [Spiroplasma endosymbiont of Lariophagus distinguendus]|uniref:hypothetical protein n=1 Tax=Spiroplasma endosymbiont of Lariophagus distinguendus TaxID=2935082 RepID=UPI00207A2844|nr:hypothetical protein [Spiroplasma endosymbiont of Lariophagus distinguendus]